MSYVLQYRRAENEPWYPAPFGLDRFEVEADAQAAVIKLRAIDDNLAHSQYRILVESPRPILP